jgi:Spy/CpxP family protein refolding chaperone
MLIMRKTRRLVLVAACLAVCLVPRGGYAQQVMQQAGPLAKPISGKAVEKMTAVLKLDSDQKALSKSLYTGYRASYKQLVADADKEMEALRSKNEAAGGHAPADRKQEFTIAREFVDKQDKLEKSFIEDMKAILTPEQMPRLERAERARRRESGLRFSFVAGEAVDLLQVLSDLKVDRDGTPELKEVTEQYDVDTDRAVVAKDKMLREVFKQVEKMEGPEPDPKLMEQMFNDFFVNGNRARDLNRQSARRMEPLLPADKRVAFDREVKKLSFPRVYSESHVDRSIKAAQGLADLSTDQKSELATLSETYSREAEGINARWAAAIEDKQSKLAGHFMEMMMGGDEEKSDDPLKVAREARKALDEKFLARVTQVLKPEQREKLPKAEEDKFSHRPEWEPDFDERGNWEEWKKEDE